MKVTLMQTVSSSADEDPVKAKLRSGWAESSMAYRCPYETDTHRETPLCKNEARDQVMLGTGLAGRPHRPRRKRP